MSANHAAKHAALRQDDTDPDEYGEIQTEKPGQKTCFFSMLWRNIEKQRLTGDMPLLLSHSGSG
jgi:hypothetical protein